MIRFADVESARRRIADVITMTPCPASEALSRLTGTRLVLKMENLQLTGSFKERGAANKLRSLDAAERARGVVTASAGNHAQAVAYHASLLGIDATIVMPEPTPINKVANTRGFGAKVVLHGASFDDAAVEARRIEEAENRVFVHAFDDDLIIAGQGTIGLELVEQNPWLDAVVIAIGGGGLAAGVGLAVKETNPRIKVYGVQTKAIPSMKTAIADGQPILVPPAKTIADGIAVKRVSDRTLELAQKYVDDIVLVDEEEIAEAILVLLEREKTVAEGAGATPLAALLHRRLPLDGKRVAAILCGGNIDVTMISRIIERGLVKTGRLMRIRVHVPDAAGALAAITRIVASTGANVVQVHHQRSFTDITLGETAIELQLETRGFEHVDEVRKALAEAGMRVD